MGHFSGDKYISKFQIHEAEPASSCTVLSRNHKLNDSINGGYEMTKKYDVSSLMHAHNHIHRHQSLWLGQPG